MRESERPNYTDTLPFWRIFPPKEINRFEGGGEAAA